MVLLVGPWSTGKSTMINYLVGTQRLTILSLWGPSVGPFVDLFKQLACLHKPPFNSPLVRLCLLHNIELAVRQIDCSSPDDSSATAPIFEKLKPIAEELSGWVDGKAPEITAAATQVIALIVSRAPLPFWHAHMDVSKEGKKKGNTLPKAKSAGGKGGGGGQGGGKGGNGRGKGRKGKGKGKKR